MLHHRHSRTRRTAGLIAGLVAALALVGASCRPLQPPGVSIPDPTGALEVLEGGDGVVHVAGWASQWVPAGNTQRPAQILIMLNGQWVPGAIEATLPRPDVHYGLGVLRLTPIMQPDMGYGFDVTVPAPAGEASVCVAGINVFYAEWNGVLPGLGDHVLYDCRKVTVT